MSYAIETKKRKFDRILEALTDGGATSAANSPARSSLNSRNDGSTTSLLPETASDSSKRRRIAASATAAKSTVAPPTDLTNHYLPSSRPAFLQRLETFRHVTRWHVPSTESINAAIWAKRGWVCVDTDTVACGSCKERLHVDLNVTSALPDSKDQDAGESGTENAETEAKQEEDDFIMVSDLYDSLVKKYREMIVTSHAESCLWRSRGCDASIQRIEGLLNTNSALSGLRNRHDTLMTCPDELPAVELSDTVSFADAVGEIEEFKSNTGGKPDVNALKLAACGWDRRSDDVIECHHCYRSLGLWLYRGETPAIGKLDAVENHLEYCPWRSAEAQDTEVQLPYGRGHPESGPAKKEYVPGWVLVLLAISKNNSQRRPKAPASIAPSEVPPSSAGSNETTSSEQREKKMKDLLRRIKEIKKPFNVKGLLRRKDKSQT
jgi:hypothetical protein